MCPCPKEQIQQKRESPGQIGSDESIVYILLQPDHWQQGGLSAAAFSKSKLKAGDLSVCRGQYCTDKQAAEHIVAPQIAKNSRRTLVGAFRAQCSEIRAIEAQNPKVRVICVIDDGTAAFPAHALLAYSELTKGKEFWQRNEQTAVRGELTRVFNAAGGPLNLIDCCTGTR